MIVEEKSTDEMINTRCCRRERTGEKDKQQGKMNPWCQRKQNDRVGRSDGGNSFMIVCQLLFDLIQPNTDGVPRLHEGDELES